MDEVMGVVPHARIRRDARLLAVIKQQSLRWKRIIIRTQLCWQPLPVFRTKWGCWGNAWFKLPQSLGFYYGSVYKSAILNYNKALEPIYLFRFVVLGVPLQD